MREVLARSHPRSGHYSNAVVSAGWIFVSGQGPLDPSSGRVVAGDFSTQARQCLRNIDAVLRDGGASLDDVVKTTVWLQDWSDYADLNAVYAETFPTHPPARSTVQGARPPGQRLAIEAIAIAPAGRGAP